MILKTTSSPCPKGEDLGEGERVKYIVNHKKYTLKSRYLERS